MSRKNAINSFFNGELEKEVRERQMVEEVTFQKKDDRKVLMNKIDELRRAELYPHTETECSSICKERGIYLFFCLKIIHRLWYILYISQIIPKKEMWTINLLHRK